jgi:hypothetical protein
MKIKVLVLDDDMNESYVDGFIDANKIIGYFTTIDNIIDESVNIITIGQTLTVSRTMVLMNYLFDKFEGDIDVNIKE